jgi:hypothetical protein
VPADLARLVIEEHLAESLLVTQAQEHARRSGDPLVVSLVEVARVSDAALARMLARQLGMALVGLLEPEAEAVRELPHDVARRHRVVPLALELAADGAGARVLRVAMADPTDPHVLAALESATGCRIEPVLATLRAVDDALARAYRGFVTVVMARDPANQDPDTAPISARVPFGGNLAPGAPSTQPYHQIEDEAPIELRLRALVQLLEEKGVLTYEEWLERIRQLLQPRE